MKLFFLVMVVSGVVLAGQAFARTDIILKEGDLEIRLDVDSRGNVLLQELPFGGAYLYSSQRQVLYAIHPDEGQVYAVPFNRLEDVPEAKMVRIGKTGKYFGLETTYWKAMYFLRTCARIYANRNAGKDVHLNAVDLIHMNALLAYLFGPTPDKSCMVYRVPPAAGKLVGLPLYTDGFHGKSEVIGVAKNDDPDHDLPKDAALLDTPAHIRFLKRALTDKNLEAFMQTSKFLTPEAKVKALRRVIREQIIPVNKNAPPSFPELE